MFFYVIQLLTQTWISVISVISVTTGRIMMREKRRCQLGYHRFPSRRQRLCRRRYRRLRRPNIYRSNITGTGRKCTDAQTSQVVNCWAEIQRTR